MTARPLCRHCGKAIALKTATIHFGHTRDAVAHGGWWIESTAKPRSKAEAQLATNWKIVTISWARDLDGVKTYILKASAWDGESYFSKWFCTGRCAEAFGVLMASQGHMTVSCADALEAQRVVLA